MVSWYHGIIESWYHGIMISWYHGFLPCGMPRGTRGHTCDVATSTVIETHPGEMFRDRTRALHVMPAVTQAAPRRASKVATKRNTATLKVVAATEDRMSPCFLDGAFMGLKLHVKIQNHARRNPLQANCQKAMMPSAARSTRSLRSLSTRNTWDVQQNGGRHTDTKFPYHSIIIFNG